MSTSTSLHTISYYIIQVIKVEDTEGVVESSGQVALQGREESKVHIKVNAGVGNNVRQIGRYI